MNILGTTFWSDYRISTAQNVCVRLWLINAFLMLTATLTVRNFFMPGYNLIILFVISQAEKVRGNRKW